LTPLIKNFSFTLRVKEKFMKRKVEFAFSFDLSKIILRLS
jgi:hypothetical protein